METWTFSPVIVAAADQPPVYLTDDIVPDLYNLSTMHTVQSTCCGSVDAGDELLFFSESVDGPSVTCSPSLFQVAAPLTLPPGLESELTVDYYEQQVEEEEGKMDEFGGDVSQGSVEQRYSGFYCQTNNNDEDDSVAEVPLHVQQLLDIDDISNSSCCCDLNHLKTLPWTPTDLLSPVTLEGLPDFTSHLQHQQQQQQQHSYTNIHPPPLPQPSVMSPVGVSTTHIILIHLQQPNAVVASGCPIRLPGTDLSILNITNNCVVNEPKVNHYCDLETLSCEVPSLTPHQTSRTTAAFQFQATDSSDVTGQLLETQFTTMDQLELMTAVEQLKSFPAGESELAAVEKSVGESAESVISDDILELMQENGFRANVVENWSTLVDVVEAAAQRETEAVGSSSSCSVTSYDPGGKTDGETSAVEENKSATSGRSRSIEGRKGTMARRNRKRKVDDIEDADAVLSEKKARRREQNRRAARGSRQRRREHSISVVKEFQRQQSIQTALKYEMQQLKQAETTLLQALVTHLETCPHSTAAAAAAAASCDVTGAA